MSERNLFTGIVRHENDVTELLVNLMQQKFFRDICLRWLLKDFIACPTTIEGLVNTIEAKHIRTQYVTKFGRPDIVIENEQCFCIIENKIDNRTDETVHQRKDYPKILKEHNKKDITGIVFLVPFGYEVKLDKSYNSVNSKVLYWEFLLSYLDEVLDQDNYIHENAIDILKALICPNLWQYEAFSDIDRKYLFEDSSIIYKSFHYVNTIFTLIKQLLWDCNLSGSKVRNIQEVGAYFTVCDYEFFIGLSINAKDENQLAVSFLSNKKVSDNVQYDENKYGWWNFYPIDRNFVDCDAGKIYGGFLENAIKAINYAVEGCFGIGGVPLLKKNEYKHKQFKKFIFMENDMLKISYSMADRIIVFCNNFIKENGFICGQIRKDENAIGCNFTNEGKEYFIGLSPVMSLLSNILDKIAFCSICFYDKYNQYSSLNEGITIYDKWIYVNLDLSFLNESGYCNQQRQFKDNAAETFAKVQKIDKR